MRRSSGKWFQAKNAGLSHSFLKKLTIFVDLIAVFISGLILLIVRLNLKKYLLKAWMADAMEMMILSILAPALHCGNSPIF